MFFFFKQKTAYEMRISDWSSDVCSSDLRRLDRGRGRRDIAERTRHAARRSAGAVAGLQRALLAADDGVFLVKGFAGLLALGEIEEIGRASCRERVCQ